MHKFLFLVNGSPDSWAGIRAKRFSGFVDDFYHTTIHYKVEGPGKDSGQKALKNRLRASSKIRTISKFIKSVLKNKPSLIYVLQVGYVNSIPALLAKIIFKTEIIIDIGDINYEVAKINGDRLGIEIMFIRNMEKLLWRLSNIIIVRGKYHKIYLDALGYKNVYFIPDGVDTDIVKTIENSETFRKEFGLDGCFTIGILGSINWMKSLEMCYGWEIVEVMKILNDMKVKRKIKGVIIGEGDGVSILKEKVKEYGIEDKIVFLGNVKQEELYKYISLMDICISTQTNNILGWMRTTGKIPIYLSCNKYILATRVGTVVGLLPEEMLVPYSGIKDLNYPLELVNRICKIYDNRDLLSLGRNNREIAKEHFEYRVLGEKVRNIVRQSRIGISKGSAQELLIQRSFL
jgi:glycosyltransferase involved in cell wall biosynthesis